jgi:signal transduction histidine kinase
MAIPPSPDQLLDIRQSLHALAQPLAILTGLVDLLLLELAEDDPKAQDMHLISEQLEKIRQIVGDIRQLTREASQEPARLGPRAHP